MVFFSPMGWTHPHEEKNDAVNPSVNSPVKLWNSWIITEPFTPTRRDYAIEMGSMWQKDTLYWVGVSFGFNLGTCIFSDSQTCQQYWDITSGGAARDSQTHGIWFTSLRWQFVNFPDTFSPMARVFVGGDLLNISGKGVNYHHLGGIGFGITQYLNERADIRLEYRYGKSNEEFSQINFGVHIKIDQLVSYFGNKLKDLGLDTLEVGGDVIDSGGDVIKGAGEAAGSVIEGAGDVIEGAGDAAGSVIPSPFSGDEEKKKQKEKEKTSSP